MLQARSCFVFTLKVCFKHRATATTVICRMPSRRSLLRVRDTKQITNKNNNPAHAKKTAFKCEAVLAWVFNRLFVFQSFVRYKTSTLQKQDNHNTRRNLRTQLKPNPMRSNLIIWSQVLKNPPAINYNACCYHCYFNKDASVLGKHCLCVRIWIGKAGICRSASR